MPYMNQEPRRTCYTNLQSEEPLKRLRVAACIRRVLCVEDAVLIKSHCQLQRSIEREGIRIKSSRETLRRLLILEVGGILHRVLRTHAIKAERRRNVDAHGGRYAVRRRISAGVA